MAEVDRFLARYFRTRERRASPRSVPLDGARATFEQVQAAEAWFTAAVALMGRAERAMEPGDLQVLARYYLNLSNAHVAPLKRELEGDEVDLQSYVDWRQMARDAGLPPGPGSVRRMQEAWRRGREGVRACVVGDEPSEAA